VDHSAPPMRLGILRQMVILQGVGSTLCNLLTKPVRCRGSNTHSHGHGRCRRLRGHAVCAGLQCISRRCNGTCVTAVCPGVLPWKDQTCGVCMAMHNCPLLPYGACCCVAWCLQAQKPLHPQERATPRAIGLEAVMSTVLLVHVLHAWPACSAVVAHASSPGSRKCQGHCVHC
jgi:hypothetical protein